MLGVACGDEDNNDGCTGHLCDAPAGQPALSDPEGGNIIFEYIYFDTELQAAFGLPSGVTTANRVMAYFMGAQTPDANTLPTPGVCNNLVTTNGWPMEIGNPHTDLDVGALTITGKNEAGADVTISVPKMPAGNDSIGRPHDIFYQTIVPDAKLLMKPNSAYTVNFGGAGSIPATTFNDAIYMANHFTVQSPALEDNGPLVAGTPYTVNWTPSTSNTTDDVLGVTWLVDATGSPTHMCPTLLSAGTFTIPGSTITEYRAAAVARGVTPDKVILLRNAIVHKLNHLPDGATTKRRIDMLSVYCWAQLMDTTP